MYLKSHCFFFLFVMRTITASFVVPFVRKEKEENSLENSSFVPLCKFVTDYRTFMKDFLKVVDFVHYLRAEGYDMVTFDKVGNGVK